MLSINDLDSPKFFYRKALNSVKLWRLVHHLGGDACTASNAH